MSRSGRLFLRRIVRETLMPRVTEVRCEVKKFSERGNTLLERASDGEVNSVDILVRFTVERIAHVKSNRTDW
jgi:hypothetical protein